MEKLRKNRAGLVKSEHQSTYTKSKSVNKHYYDENYYPNSAFFCLNTHFYNILQKKALVILTKKYLQYRELFRQKFGRELYEFIGLDLFLQKGWLYFDLNKFTKFAISKGYRRKLHSCLENWVKRAYGKKTKEMIEDMIFSAIELAEENEQEGSEYKILLKNEHLI